MRRPTGTTSPVSDACPLGLTAYASGDHAHVGPPVDRSSSRPASSRCCVCRADRGEPRTHHRRASRRTRRDHQPQASRRPMASCATTSPSVRGGLAKLGVGRGDRVALLCGNGLYFVEIVPRRARPRRRRRAAEPAEPVPGDRAARSPRSSAKRRGGRTGGSSGVERCRSAEPSRRCDTSSRPRPATSTARRPSSPTSSRAEPADLVEVERRRPRAC